VCTLFNSQLPKPVLDRYDLKSKDNLTELQKLEYTGRTGFIEKGGWDKMPGQKDALPGVSQECAFGLEDLMKK
jgi:hypothetical protein